MADQGNDSTSPRLYYEVHGRQGPFLLLVHGMLSGRSQWLPNLPALSSVCRPVVVELFGHGRSPAPREPEAYTPAGYVEEFERVRRTLGAERWLVCGQSLGAALTLRYALDHPDHILAQVFTNSNSALAEENFVPDAVRRFVEAQARRLETEGRRALDEHRLNPARNRRLAPDVREALLADYALHNPAGIALTGLHTVPASSVRARLRENKVPALLVVGERESRFREHRLFAEETMPGLEVVGLNAGHAVNLEAADEFNIAVTRFIELHAVYGRH